MGDGREGPGPGAGTGTGGGGGGLRGVGGGKEGDWECSSCRNRNYAFRSFCNRCKQPRLLVDTKTPADSKWLPRIGDWICTGCSNNNYASREKCKKCGQPKEVAAMPAVAIPGASVPTHPTHFARGQGCLDLIVSAESLQPPLTSSSNWPLGGGVHYGNLRTDPHGFHSASDWPLGGNMSGFTYGSQASQPSTVPHGNALCTGDWMCTCGFHNYASRVQCKKCDSLMPKAPSSSLISPAVTALRTKRMASEEFVHNWDNKRLNAGHAYGLQQAYPGFAPFLNPGDCQSNSIYPAIPSGNTAVAPNLQGNLQVSCVPAMSILVGKGAKQWRDGDWMCTNCNNHNYASRAQCNRCKNQREGHADPVTVV